MIISDQNCKMEVLVRSFHTKDIYTIREDDGVHSETTILELKEIISKIISFPTTRQRLIYPAREVEDSKSLAQISYKSNSFIHLILKAFQGTITVEDLKQKKISVEVGFNDRVIDVKQKIEAALNHPISYQRLWLWSGGKRLQNDKHLFEYCITDSTRIILLVKSWPEAI